MQITSLSIENYKSLRSLTVHPRKLTVLIGANASGKSNLADCVDFVSEVYRHGLEVAVARKGGYENIAHRKQRRSKSAVKLDITAEYEALDDFTAAAPRRARVNLQTRHAFSFVAKGSSIRAEFQVEEESIEVRAKDGDSWAAVLRMERAGDEIKVWGADERELERLFSAVPKNVRSYILGLADLQLFVGNSSLVASSELFTVSIGRFIGLLRAFVSGLGDVRVFQMSPATTREFGVPTPGPELGRLGNNLPAVVDLLQKQHAESWTRVIQAMRRILPGLVEIEVGYTTSRTLGLFFREIGVGRPWSVNEVSDGTVQTLALLVAIYDPRSSALVIEEPENSIHPWIIRNVLAACVDAAKRKQILLTTHSPIVVNYVKPQQVWVIWRKMGESRIVPLTYLDPEFLQMWEEGQVSTFDIIDSGAIPEAIPPAPTRSVGGE